MFSWANITTYELALTVEELHTTVYLRVPGIKAVVLSNVQLGQHYYLRNMNDALGNCKLQLRQSKTLFSLTIDDFEFINVSNNIISILRIVGQNCCKLSRFQFKNKNTLLQNKPRLSIALAF